MKTEKRRRIIVLILACLFTLMQLTGWQISMRYGTSVHRNAFFQNIGMLSGIQFVFAAFIEAAFWYAVIDVSFYLLGGRKRNRHAKKGEKYTAPDTISGRKGWILVGVGLFCCLFLGLLGCWPGIYAYDAQGQLAQAMYPEVEYATHHPLLHTFVMGKIITIGYHVFGENLSMGVLMYSVIQMLICTVIFTYSIYSIWIITRRKWLTVVAFLYYAFFPTVVLFTFCTTKDVLCSAFLHLMVLLVYEIYQDTNGFFIQKGKVILLIFSGVLMCLFRNNGIYAVALMAIFASVSFPKKWRLGCVVFIPIMLLSFLSGKGLQAVLHAEISSMAEAFSVPIQQIARVYNEEGEEAFTEEELGLIYRAVSAEVLLGYQPMISDDVKYAIQFNEEVVTHKGEYVRLWMNTGVRNPKEYMLSFLDNTYQAWYPGTCITRYPERSESDYLDIEGFDTVEKEPKIQWLYDIYHKIAAEFFYQKIPGLRLLFSVGAMFWVVLFTWFYGIWKKDSGIMAALLMILCFCATCFLGPTVLVRYYLNLFYIFPVCIAFLSGR